MSSPSSSSPSMWLFVCLLTAKIQNHSSILVFVVVVVRAFARSLVRDSTIRLFVTNRFLHFVNHFCDLSLFEWTAETKLYAIAMLVFDRRHRNQSKNEKKRTETRTTNKISEAFWLLSAFREIDQWSFVDFNARFNVFSLFFICARRQFFFLLSFLFRTEEFSRFNALRCVHLISVREQFVSDFKLILLVHSVSGTHVQWPIFDCLHEMRSMSMKKFALEKYRFALKLNNFFSRLFLPFQNEQTFSVERMRNDKVWKLTIRSFNRRQKSACKRDRKKSAASTAAQFVQI